MRSLYLNLVPKEYGSGPAPRAEDGKPWSLSRWAMDFDGRFVDGLHGRPLGEVVPSFRVLRQIIAEDGQGYICHCLAAVLLPADIVSIEIENSVPNLYQVMAVGLDDRSALVQPYLDCTIEFQLWEEEQAQAKEPPEPGHLHWEWEGDYEEAPLGEWWREGLPHCKLPQ